MESNQKPMYYDGSGKIILSPMKTKEIVIKPDRSESKPYVNEPYSPFLYDNKKITDLSLSDR